MSKHRVTEKGRELAELAPMMGGEAIFRRSRTRSVNSPEVSLAHEALTKWLNGENSGDTADHQHRNSPESTDRILNLLKLVKIATASFERLLPPLFPHSYGTATETNERREQWEKGQIFRLTTVTGALADYATVPYLAFQPSSKLWGIGQWPVAQPGSEPSYQMHLQPTLRPYGEVMAAHGILELARRNALSRIRQCDCRRWYFAKREDGVACSDVCRKRIHDRKPEVIEKRRLKNKENSELHNAGKVKEAVKPAVRKLKKLKIEKVRRNG